MGGGNAMNFLNAGIPVTIVEQKKDALDPRPRHDPQELRGDRRQGPAHLGRGRDRMGLLSGSLDMKDLGTHDLIIEAVFENMDIKKDVFRALDGIAKPGAILASNTSYLNVDEIASVTSRPESVIGMHFFSPANVMRSWRWYGPKRRRNRSSRTAMKLGPKIGKLAVLVGVCHGFVGNRMLAQRQREATRLVEEGRCLGRRSRPLRVRPADGTLRDERPRRPRYRLVA